MLFFISFKRLNVNYKMFSKKREFFVKTLLSFTMPSIFIAIFSLFRNFIRAKMSPFE